jgi:hypothetical protein
LFASFVPWIAVALLASADADPAVQRARAVVEREKVQKKLEHGELKVDDDPFKEGLFGRRWSFFMSAPTLASLGWTVLYAGLAGVAIVAVFAIIQAVRRRRGDSALTPASLRAAGDQFIDKDADSLFAEADRLAAEGRWDEAVHLLLLTAIRRLSDEFGAPRRSRTSRELLSHFRLEGERLSAFRHLVAAVERVVFGEQPTDEATFLRCRDLVGVVRGTLA